MHTHVRVAYTATSSGYCPANLRRMSAARPACCVCTAPNSIVGATLPAARMALGAPSSAAAAGVTAVAQHRTALLVNKGAAVSG